MKKLIILCLVVRLMAALTTPAGILDYVIDAPKGPDHGKSTSVEVVHMADGGALKNEDISKNAALIPPGFGGASVDSVITGTWPTPNLAPEDMAVGVANGGGIPIVSPPSADASTILPAEPEQGTGSTALGYAPVTSDLYYSGGCLGTLKIPSINLSVWVYEGTDNSTLVESAGHSEGTSTWNDSVSIAGHNRGVWDDFGDLHTLEQGDTVTWITKLGTRTYEAISVERIRETNINGTVPSTENMLTLYTCVHNQRKYRWQVRMVEVVWSARAYELIFSTKSDPLLQTFSRISGMLFLQGVQGQQRKEEG